MMIRETVRTIARPILETILRQSKESLSPTMSNGALLLQKARVLDEQTLSHDFVFVVVVAVVVVVVAVVVFVFVYERSNMHR